MPSNYQMSLEGPSLLRNCRQSSSLMKLQYCVFQLKFMGETWMAVGEATADLPLFRSCILTGLSMHFSLELRFDNYMDSMAEYERESLVAITTQLLCKKVDISTVICPRVFLRQKLRVYDFVWEILNALIVFLRLKNMHSQIWSIYTKMELLSHSIIFATYICLRIAFCGLNTLFVYIYIYI